MFALRCVGVARTDCVALEPGTLIGESLVGEMDRARSARLAALSALPFWMSASNF